jgi:hypothetical protein
MRARLPHELRKPVVPARCITGTRRATSCLVSDRIDLYRAIHVGIRKFLFDLIVHAGEIDYRSDAEWTGLAGRARETFQLLRNHARVEEEVFQRALVDRVPEAVAWAHTEHDREADELGALDALVNRIGRAARDDRSALGVQLYRALGAFCADYLLHMAREEEELMPVFWKHFDDTELAELRRRAHSRMASEQQPTA